jgi:dihydrodipicolinate synthase/N-acetylneuraminate lyase
MVKGMNVALVTPLDERGALDERGLERILGRALAAGVSGVCPVGSTGEGPRLGRERRLQVVDAVVRRVGDRVPVIPAPAVETLDGGAAELEELAARGASAALVAPPAYYPLSDADVLRFYERLGDRSPLPLLLYNMPALTKITLAPGVVGTLARHPRVVGIKDSSRDFEYMTAVRYATDGGFAVLTGSDSMLLASMVLGADGAITASANLAPELGCALYRHAAAGEMEAARTAQRQLFELVRACRVGEFPAGWKAALELAGLCEGHLAAPAGPLAGEPRERLRVRLTELGVL